MNRLGYIVFLGAMIACGAASAQPAEPHPGPGPGRRDREDGAGQYWRWRLGRESMAATGWEEAAAFVREHSPNRWQAFEAMPDGRAKMQVRRVIVQRYRNLMALKEQDESGLYALAVKRLELEDQAWELSAALASADNDQRRREIDKELAEKVRQLVQLGLLERAGRIERLQAALTREQQRLAHDQQNIDEVTGKHLRRWQRQAPGLGDGPGYPSSERRPGDEPDAPPPPGDQPPPPPPPPANDP